MTGIYKYTNKITGQVYIGQAVDIAKRQSGHLKKPSPHSYFDADLKKYGIESFDFKIIEECDRNDLAEREKYWIKEYNSYMPDNKNGGYNLTRGGEQYIGEENPWSRLTENEVKEIIEKLANTKISIQQLSKDYNVHYNTIGAINRCKTWSYLHNYKNNIRMESQGSLLKGELGVNKITEEQAKYIIKLLESDKRSLASISREENLSLNILYDINRCKTWTHLHNYKKNIRSEYREGGDA